MAFEEPLRLDLALENLVTSQSAGSEELQAAAEEQATLARVKEPKSTIEVGDISDDFTRKESQFLRAELTAAQNRCRKIMSQYDELYTYCEKIVHEAENAKQASLRAANIAIEERDALEKECTRLKATLEKAENQLSRSESKKATAERMLFSFRQQIETLKRQCQEAADARARLMAENEELQVYRSRLEVNRNALLRAMDLFPHSIRTIEEMTDLLDGLIEKISTQGTSQLSPKAGKILCEQLKGELESLHNIHRLLAGTVEPQRA